MLPVDMSEPFAGSHHLDQLALQRPDRSLWRLGLRVARVSGSPFTLELFSTANLDFIAITSLDVALEGGALLFPTVLMPRGVRVGAQLPQSPA